MSVAGVLYGAAPACPSCGVTMQKARISSGNFVGIILALLVFFVGLLLTVAVPILGWVAGPLLILLSLGMGGKRSKVWR